MSRQVLITVGDVTEIVAALPPYSRRQKQRAGINPEVTVPAKRRNQMRLDEERRRVAAAA